MHWMVHRTTLYDVPRSFLRCLLCIRVVLIYQTRIHLSQAIQKVVRMRQVAPVKKPRQMKKLRQVVMMCLKALCVVLWSAQWLIRGR